jgi:predicted nucleotidyltransferase component of viral defense system
VITRAEVLALRGEWQVAAEVIEKDHALGWLLAGIAQEPRLRSWVFKGGTCLRKCYFETYRFSEDLDFTVATGGPITGEQLVPIFRDVAAWMLEEGGVELVVDDRSFAARRNLRGQPTTEGRVAFLGPLRLPQPAKIKLDLTTDELIALPPEPRPVAHPYSDATAAAELPSLALVRCYPLVELLAEKLRALAQRCRPRDLYDVVHTHRHADVARRSAAVAALLARKCAFVGIPTPTLASLEEGDLLAQLRIDWAAMLAHQLPQLPDVEVFLAQLDDVFAWLGGARLAVPRPAPVGPGETAVRPQTVRRWRAGAPIELMRFAGTNRLRIEIDYQAKDGRWGWRNVEPYALRRSNDGHLLVFVVNDQRQPRTYRIDRIRAIRVTGIPFTPRYRVEL